MTPYPGFRGHRQKVLERRARAKELTYTTWITAAELWYGVAKGKSPDNKIVTEAFLRTTPIVGFDRRSVQLFGDFKAFLERKGERLDDADLLIASIALANEATLVTGNRRHFTRIAGLVVENWIK